MLVYVIEENWDNGETYEMAMDDTKPIGVCITKDAAQKLIKERKSELIEIAKKYDESKDKRSISFKEGGQYDNDGGITFTHSFREDPFDTLNFGTDKFWWEIKEVPFISA